MISSSVVYGHSTKYSYEILHEYLLLMVISLLAYVAIFSDSFIFGKATSSHFFRVTFFKLPQELLFQTSSFFRAAFFLRSFFGTVTFSLHFFSFSEQLLFQSETTTEKPHLKNRKFFSAVTFRNRYLQKISTEELLFRSRFFCTTSIFSKKQDLGKSYFFRKAIFYITFSFWRATFLMPFS